MKTPLAILCTAFLVLAAQGQVSPPPPAARPADPAPAPVSQPSPTVFISGAANSLVQPVPTPRTALLMGVDAYTDPTFPTLPAQGIASDLNSMKTVLEGLGFTVTVVRNPTLGEAKTAVDTFGSAVKTRGGTSLFYFTGYGAEHEGKNYLIPRGTAVSDAADLNDEALSANRILARMESAGTKVNLLFLDCCRNALTKSGGDTGLAPMTARGALIGFATRSGDVSATTVSGSPYTQALVARLGTPALSLPDMHTLVTQDLEAGAQKQRPGSYVDLGGIYQMIPGAISSTDGSAELARLRLEIEALRNSPSRSGGFQPPSPTSPGMAIVPGSAPPAPTPAAGSTPLLGQAFANSLGMKFVPVPGTKVLFCVHEVRNADYSAYAAASSGVDSGWKSAASGKEDHPVVNVSWEDANAFCQWLSRKEGKTYRLPTDHEWSLAVGIGGREDATASLKSKNDKITAVYPWEGDYPPSPKDGNYDVSGVTDGYAGTAPVMQFKASRLGIYDLGGNVWEWCGDWYDKEQEYRVLRGGSWIDLSATVLLSSDRDIHRPSNRGGNIGFRVVLELGSGG